MAAPSRTTTTVVVQNRPMQPEHCGARRGLAGKTALRSYLSLFQNRTAMRLGAGHHETARRPRPSGRRAVGWVESEVDDWLIRQIESSREAQSLRHK